MNPEWNIMHQTPGVRVSHGLFHRVWDKSWHIQQIKCLWNTVSCHVVDKILFLELGPGNWNIAKVLFHVVSGHVVELVHRVGQVWNNVPGMILGLMDAIP